MKVRVISAALAVMVAIGLAASVLSAQTNANVQIEYLSIDGTTLTIVGKNFGSAPAVFIGEDTAVVSRNSDKEIVAATPALAKGFHLVKVVRDASDGGSAVTTLQIE